MKKLFLGLVLVITACGGGSSNNGSGGGSGDVAPSYVDEGAVAPQGADNVLGRWVSDPMVNGQFTFIMKLRVEENRTTMGVVCKGNGKTLQVAQSAASKIIGNKIEVEAAPKREVTDGDLNCTIHETQKRTYEYVVRDNTLSLVGQRGVMKRAQ